MPRLARRPVAKYVLCLTSLSLLVVICLLGRGYGQSTSSKEPTPFTYRAYANLIQIPTLILDYAGRAIPEGQVPHLTVRIDAGKLFAIPPPRLEGDDPISLAIVLDVTGDENDLLPPTPNALKALADALHPGDRVSVYALDCELTSTLYAGPPEALRTAIEQAARRGRARGKDRGVSCWPYLALWDGLFAVMNSLATQPGRHVMMVIADGHDAKSQHRWREVKDEANSTATAVFGYAAVSESNSSAQHDAGDENKLALLCGSSGGIFGQVTSRTLSTYLTGFIPQLRGRYIVEFARPLHLSAGPHSFDVRAQESQFLVLASGVSVPLADPTIVNDEHTLPSDPTRAPEAGSRRIMPHTP